MKASGLDLLEKSELQPAQARAILQAMESELSVHDSVLATKADIFARQAELELKFEGLRTDMQAMRAELIRWNFAFWVAQLAAMAALLKLLK